MSEGRGQPTKYKPEYCQMLIEHMAKGLSYEAFAALVNVHKDTIYEWEKAHEEFAEAKKLGVAQGLLFWEKLGIDNIINKSDSFGEGQGSSRSINATVWIFNMKNRFKWRDKQPDENDQVNVNLTLAERMANARKRTEKK